MALSFLAASVQRITLGSPSTLDNIFATGGTLSFWVFFPISVGAGYWTIIDKRQGGSGVTGWELAITSDVLSFYQETTGGTWTNTNTISVGQWHHIAMTYDKSSLTNNPTFWINGNSDATITVSAPTSIPSDASAPMGLGWIGDPGTFIIEDYACWSVMLTPFQIKQLASSRMKYLPLGINTVSPSVYLPLDEYPNGAIAVGSGSIRDRGPNGNNGTPATSPTYFAGNLTYP